MMTRLILLGLLTSLIACEPGDLVNLPSAPGRITILSYNEVDQPWLIAIAPTLPPSARFGYIGGMPNAIVTIYEDGNFQEKLTVDTTNQYPIDASQRASDFRSTTNSPKPGHHYKIIAEAEGYPTATAEYTQPNVIPADITFELRERKPVVYIMATSDVNGTRIEYDTATQWIFDVSFTFNDPPEDNFYDFWIRTAAREDSLNNRFLGGFLSIDGDPMSIDPILGGQIIDDKDFAGRRVTLNFIYSVTDYQIPGFPVDLPSWFRISLRSMNEAQYKFNIQVRKQQLASYDPYAQPVTTFTNVENGLGVFGEYTSYSKTFNYVLQ